MTELSIEETTDPLYADRGNFYKVEKWTKDGQHVDCLLWAGNRVETARQKFGEAVKHRPRGRYNHPPALNGHRLVDAGTCREALEHSRSLGRLSWFRPSQIRASAAVSALIIPSAHALEKKYRCLQMPVAILAGAEDRLIGSEQSAHLHRDIPHSTLRRVPGTGHMVHRTATAEIMTAIDSVAVQNRKPAVVTSAA